VGVGIAVILVLVAVMITPLAYSYTEKQEVELERLLTEYIIKEPNEGGPPEVELVDFKKLAQDELASLHKELLDLQLIINGIIADTKEQNITIQKEEIKIELAQQKIQKEWGAAPIDNTQLSLEYEKLNDLTNELKTILFQKNLTEKKINTKELLQEIQMYDAKLIGVNLSNSCISSGMMGGLCPTYEDLLSLDSSNQEISGGFSMYDGYFHREKSQFVDSFRFYDTEDTIRIILDPHQELSSRIKMITIENKFGFFTDAYDKKLEDGLRTMKKDRIINDCYTANISSENWRLLLPDTIFAFRNGCSNMEIDDTVKFNMPYTKLDKSSFTQIKYQEWLKEAKLNCKVKC